MGSGLRRVRSPSRTGNQGLGALRSRRTHIVISAATFAAGVAATTLLTFSLPNPPVHRILPPPHGLLNARIVDPFHDSHHRRRASQADFVLNATTKGTGRTTWGAYADPAAVHSTRLQVSRRSEYATYLRLQASSGLSSGGSSRALPPRLPPTFVLTSLTASPVPA